MKFVKYKKDSGKPKQRQVVLLRITGRFLDESFVTAGLREDGRWELNYSDKYLDELMQHEITVTHYAVIKSLLPKD